MECEIIGCFWRGPQQHGWLKPFVGTITLNDNGTFEGTTEDYYGKAKIKGQLSDARLEFKKEYEPGSRGAKGKIWHILKGDGYKKGDKIIYGGWKGIYQLPKTDDSDDSIDNQRRFGQATCTIHPL